MKKNFINKYIYCVVTLLLTITFPFNSFADGDEEETLTRLGAGFSHSAIVEPDGSLLMWGDGRDGQLGIDSYQELLPKLILKNVKYVALGYGSSAIIKNDGTLWTTGLNGEGQLGDGTKINRAKFKKIMDNVFYEYKDAKIECPEEYTYNSEKNICEKLYYTDALTK